MTDDELDRQIEILATPCSAGGTLAVLDGIIRYWHGPLEPRRIRSDDPLLALRLPEPLRWWYRRGAGRRSVFSGQNRLLAPADLEVLDGRLLFYVENQGVYLWGTETEGEDPPVWGQFNGEEPWVREEVKLTGFLIQACVLEAIFSARCVASVAWADEATLDRVTSPLRPLPLGRWRWPAYPSRFWSGGGAFVFAGPNGPPDGEQFYSIWVGAKTGQPLAYLKTVVDDRWEVADF